MSSEYVCNVCSYQALNFDHFQRHATSKSHIDQMCKLPKDSLLECSNCNKYSTQVKSNYRKHMTTCKGIKQDDISCAICSKKFKTRSGLFKHKQKCVSPPPDERREVITERRIGELLVSLEELVSVFKTNIISNTINHVHQHIGDNVNNQISINVFLNEKCKDAMNIMDFVKSIKLHPDILDKFSKEGYVAAMSNIMVNELNNLPITQRPVHCTDVRRLTLHVKHNNEWFKETKQSPILMTALTTLRRACTSLVSQRYPPGRNKFEPDSMQEAEYFHIYREISGGKAASLDVLHRRNTKIVTCIGQNVRLSKQDVLL